MKPGPLLALLGILAGCFVVGLFLLDIVPVHRTVIVTVPGGAEVSVGGATPMPAPLSVPVHRRGTRVSVFRDGFVRRDTTLTPGSDTVLVYLPRETGLAVFTDPSGLTVRWESFEAASPCTIPLPGVGSFTVSIAGERGVMDTFTHVMLAPELSAVTRELPFPLPGEPPLVRIPGPLLFSESPGLLAGAREVTVAEYAAFLNAVDPELERTDAQLPGRTVMMDSVLRCNWTLPVEAPELEGARYTPRPGMGNLPMYGMTQQGAELYCRWLSGSDPRGFEYRLPDPGEHRALAEAGGTWSPAPGEFNCSDSADTILTRHPEIGDGFAGPAPAGTYPANPWGLYDTSGNLWEWTSRRGTAAGGGWLSSLDDCRPGTLADFSPEIGYPFVGLRVVADPPRQAPTGNRGGS